MPAGPTWRAAIPRSPSESCAPDVPRLPVTPGLALLVLAGILTGAALAAEPPPWETWHDLHRLPELHAGDQALLRSSRCPDGCRFDRHSSGDWRYVYVDGEEGVIFDEAGAGAITRIWMTMGAGTSDPLDPDVRLRIYVDGAAVPVVDVPLPAFFDGSTPPFVPPLAGDRPTSSGGNFSYVPIPYRNGCRVALVGADEKRIWFQINFHRLADADGVATFTGGEDLSGLADLLGTQGGDPWPPDAGTSTSGSASLEPGGPHGLWAVQGPGSVTALKLSLDPVFWPEVELWLTFDGKPAVRMALADFFAIGRIGPQPTRSLMVGLDDDGYLYAYFPMPFFDAADLALFHRGSTTAEVLFEVRVSGAAPSATSGLFGAELSHSEATPTGVDFPLLTLAGHGKLAGAFVELGSTGGTVRTYLEGDERYFIDRSPHPAVYGTGVEDFFNGGFFFDQGPFSLALHGAPYTELEAEGLPVTAAYRLMLTDGITFENHLAAKLEGGPVGDVSMQARAVTYFYRRKPSRLRPWDRLDLGRESDRDRHLYRVEGPHALQGLAALFEGEPPSSAMGVGVYRPPGSASFVMRAPPDASRFRLRRRFDAGVAGQRATILVGGEVAGFFPAVDVNEDRRWREVDIDLAGSTASEELEITVVAEPGPPAAGGDVFTAFRYELWTDGGSEIFADGFESGETSAWFFAVGAAAEGDLSP